MRNFDKYFMFSFVTLLFVGCSNHNLQYYADKHFNNKKAAQEEQVASPTKNEALNKVSPINQNRQDGAMQKSLDNWLETDWTPTIQKDEAIKKVNENKSRNFTLQEYVDKAIAYSKNKPDSNESSGIQNMNKLPVIGK